VKKLQYCCDGKELAVQRRVTSGLRSHLTVQSQVHWIGH